MTKDEVVKLGIASQAAKDRFFLLSQQNTAIDTADREKQIEIYERARADMHEAMNRHHAGLEQLGLLVLPQS